MPKVDYRLNARVDARLGDKASLAALARVAALNGATLIHYRDETSSTREMIEQARAVGAALQPEGLQPHRCGVHLGDGRRWATARSIMGTAIIGLTVDERTLGRFPRRRLCQSVASSDAAQRAAEVVARRSGRCRGHFHNLRRCGTGGGHIRIARLCR